MSYSTLLWGVFEVDSAGEHQRLIAVASSRSSAGTWQRDHVATRRTRIERLACGEPPAPMAETAALGIEHLRKLARWHRRKRGCRAVERSDPCESKCRPTLRLERG